MLCHTSENFMGCENAMLHILASFKLKAFSYYNHQHLRFMTLVSNTMWQSKNHSPGYYSPYNWKTVGQTEVLYYKYDQILGREICSRSLCKLDLISLSRSKARNANGSLQIIIEGGITAESVIVEENLEGQTPLDASFRLSEGN